jgi:hypothetical protein
MAVEVVYVQDVKTTRVHKRFHEDGVRGLYAYEAEASDTSGAFTVLTQSEMERIPAEALCRRCFPEGDPR